MISTRDLEWAAGFLEGEGSFLASKSGLSVRAPQVNPEPLLRLKRLYGGSVYHYDYRRNARQSTVYIWTVTASTAAGLMMTLFSLMSDKRKEQIKRALAAWKARPPYGKHKTHCKRGHEFTPENTLPNGVMPSGKPGRQCRACKRERAA